MNGGETRRRFVFLARLPCTQTSTLLLVYDKVDAAAAAETVYGEDELTVLLFVVFRTKRGWWSCLLTTLQRTRRRRSRACARKASRRNSWCSTAGTGGVADGEEECENEGACGGRNHRLTRTKPMRSWSGSWSLRRDEKARRWDRCDQEGCMSNL